MIKSAESVSPKHPDKLCDQVSDAILDAILKEDPHARVAVEALGGHGKIVVMGEVSTSADVDYEALTQSVVGDELEPLINIDAQSPEIAHGVDTGGAGDQGVMVGYATNETPDLIPLETWLARDLNKTIFESFPHDGKTQITLNDGTVEAVVASFQNASANELGVLVADWLKDKKSASSPVVHCNPAGDWKIGGFDSDVGLTGRKLAVDNYGPHIPIGGGCFSGKDATKVDRSAAYMARKIAVDLLNKHRAAEVFVYLAYAIGVAEPVHVEARIDGKFKRIAGYDLTPQGIIETLNLRKPMYTQTARYGHFGNGFSWDT